MYWDVVEVKPLDAFGLFMLHRRPNGRGSF